ncbi:MAG: late competence development ComFB family protein [Gammaproteobacteria bacterium]|nr:late competence development ComFB family protein [Gammaproteobacteria bacterium]NIR97787.1 late competence development ComFB family protein [Gammaproteobacteria bacterium]NIT63839.1 late competence development ComFB family protein [Gammaproteobacteria bacterium]NIV20809.1 competence protein ComFB [Gammaproteobacteria bacterium]NIY32419.1 competence protein ComFB [Gammaproteobacteria bacterium]
MADTQYQFGEVALGTIRNRQEKRVIASMHEQAPSVEGFCGCRLCVEDVYAISLNSLPAHYVQAGSMVLQKTPPSEEDVRRAVADAFDKVRVRPNHPQ